MKRTLYKSEWRGHLRARIAIPLFGLTEVNLTLAARNGALYTQRESQMLVYLKMLLFFFFLLQLKTLRPPTNSVA